MQKTLIGLCIFALFAGLQGSVATAEIYKWKDRDGRLHFSQDLRRVPAEFRKQAETGAVTEGSGKQIQQYRAPSPAASRARGVFNRKKRSAQGTGGSRAAEGEIHRIRVAKTGSSMRVTVRLNNSIDVPFIIDTGASDVVVPAWAIEKMGVDLEGARTNFYRTANGVVEHSVLILDDVALGSAKAQNVPAAVSPSMSEGLLGLTFFNHFRYNVDPVAGLVTLQENGLAEEGRIRGGRSQDQWRYAFLNLGRRIDRIEQEIDNVGSNRSRRVAELEAMIEETERQIRVLEGEADEARVPMSWRD